MRNRTMLVLAFSAGLITASIFSCGGPAPAPTPKQSSWVYQLDLRAINNLLAKQDTRDMWRRRCENETNLRYAYILGQYDYIQGLRKIDKIGEDIVPIDPE